MREQGAIFCAQRAGVYWKLNLALPPERFRAWYHAQNTRVFRQRPPGTGPRTGIGDRKLSAGGWRLAAGCLISQSPPAAAYCSSRWWLVNKMQKKMQKRKSACGLKIKLQLNCHWRTCPESIITTSLIAPVYHTLSSYACAAFPSGMREA